MKKTASGICPAHESTTLENPYLVVSRILSRGNRTYSEAVKCRNLKNVNSFFETYTQLNLTSLKRGVFSVLFHEPWLRTSIIHKYTKPVGLENCVLDIPNPTYVAYLP